MHKEINTAARHRTTAVFNHLSAVSSAYGAFFEKFTVQKVLTFKSG